MSDLADLRMQLAEARAALREAKDDHETMKAIREQAAIDRGATGKNAEERARALTIQLNYDDDYLAARQRLRQREYEVDTIQAQIAVAEDARDADKLRSRDAATQALDRYAAALERLARQNPIQAAIDDHALRVARGELPF